MATASTFVANICGRSISAGSRLTICEYREELTLQRSLVLGL